jgi:hypothetical protein
MTEGTEPMIEGQRGDLRGYPLTELQDADLTNRFTYHAPREDQLPRYAKLRNMGRSLAEEIVRRTPPSREQSLALTHLEEAIMWANAAIARNEK